MSLAVAIVATVIAVAFGSGLRKRSAVVGTCELCPVSCGSRANTGQ